jgi:sugar lactone lactonase YvrE
VSIAFMRCIASGAYAEGPLFWNGGLRFVEYAADAVRSLGPGAPSLLQLDPGSGPAGLGVFGSSAGLGGGGLAVACYDAHHVLLLLGDGRRLKVEVPFPNDLASDERGGLYVTSSAARAELDPFQRGLPPTGGIYHISYAHPDSSPPVAVKLPLDRPIDYANGIAFDGANLYVSEHFQNRVLRCGRGGGALETHVCLPSPVAGSDTDVDIDSAVLGPDGLALDRRTGRLYVAHHGAGTVLVVSKARTLDDVWTLPPGHLHVTNVCVHGGAAFVTTAEGGVFEHVF